MTLKEISYNILNLYRGGRSSNNEHISLRQIEFNVKHYRAMLLRRDFARNGLVSRHVEQDLGCIELEKVNASKCCKLPKECDVVRTVVDIPRTVRFNFTDAITHVSDPSGLITIPVVDALTVQFLPYDRFTKNTRKAYMIEDKLYIYNPGGMDTINIRGVFEDPEVVAKFECDGRNCYDDQSDFPMPLDMVQAITDGLVKGTFMMIAQTVSDTENDTLQTGHLMTPQTQSRRGQS
jgi:hypothetical protein